MTNVVKSNQVAPEKPKKLVDLVRSFKEATLSPDDRVELWRTVHKLASDFLRGFFHNISEHDRENLAQEVVLKLLCKGLEVDNPESAAAYITQCAKLAGFDFLRTQKKRARLAPTTDIDYEPGICDSRASEPSARILLSEVRSQVTAAVRELPTVLAATMQAQLDDPDVSVNDLAMHFKIAVGTVKSRRFHGRKLLKQNLLKVESLL
jgi:DNA-directed RNA polymerase specialized sigma24 family protein